MSNYFGPFNSVDSKLVELLDEHQMIRKFKTDTYPITLVITQNVSPEAQMALFDTAKDGASSRDAKLVFSFHVDELGVKVSGRLVMSDALMNKIKGMAKKMHYLYLQGEYATLAERQKGFRRVDPLDDEDDDEPDPEVEEPEEGDPDQFDEFFDSKADQDQEEE